MQLWGHREAPGCPLTKAAEPWGRADRHPASSLQPVGAPTAPQVAPGRPMLEVRVRKLRLGQDRTSDSPGSQVRVRAGAHGGRSPPSLRPGWPHRAAGQVGGWRLDSFVGPLHRGCCWNARLFPVLLAGGDWAPEA